jgi:4'-phosphopantetheinyl transferase EntD
LIDEILPGQVIAVEAREDAEASEGALFPEERGVVAMAVEKRQREYATARTCARQALAGLGVPAGPIATGARGEPLWPAGVVGSITHTEGYRACAVASTAEILTVGIDAEPNAPLPTGIFADIAGPGDELPELGGDGAEVHWDRVLFSAKESVYKAWYPLTERWLGFEQVAVEIDPRGGGFRARLLVPGPLVDGRPLLSFRGRWRVCEQLVLTAVAVARSSSARGSDRPQPRI